jgi:phosphate uptake regulator
MKRKVIQLAEKTKVISLPQEWVKEWNIEKGDELDTKITGSNIIFSTKKQKENQKTTINTENTPERIIRWWLSSLHKKGFDEIEIFYKKEQIPIFNSMIKNLYTGFTITEQTEKRCVLQAISKDDEEIFDNVMRRAFLITLSLADSLPEIIQTKNYQEIQKLLDLEKTNNQLTNFCQRIINKRGLTEPTKNTFYYIINWNLEKIADDYKYIIEHITEKKIKISEETTDIIKKTNKLLRGFYEFFYNKKQEKLIKLSEEKKEIQKEIEKTIKEKKEETIILSRILSLADKITDFSASMIAIHTEDQEQISNLK